MKKRWRIAGLGTLVGLLALVAALSVTAGCIRCDESIQVNGVTRHYRMHVPRDIADRGAVPLVLVDQPWTGDHSENCRCANFLALPVLAQDDFLALPAGSPVSSSIGPVPQPTDALNSNSPWLSPTKRSLTWPEPPAKPSPASSINFAAMVGWPSRVPV